MAGSEVGWLVGWPALWAWREA